MCAVRMHIPAVITALLILLHVIVLLLLHVRLHVNMSALFPKEQEDAYHA